MSRARRSKRSPNGSGDGAVRELALLAAREAADRKGSDVALLDLRGLTSATDFFVIASGESDVQVKSIADRIEARLRDEKDARPWHVEGLSNAYWVLLDYVDFVVHVFHKDARDYYDLERLWADAEVERFGEGDGSSPEAEGASEPAGGEEADESSGAAGN
ncbi:MAG: ribosome silencing factor [Gemmatimonadota bacterium]|nr:ribosome silencing factor [Gemmatimonadota bacterium]